MRSMVSRSMLPRPVRSSSCLGRRRRLEGQNRSPTPPAMITTSTSTTAPLFLHHLDVDRHRHVAVQAQIDDILAERLDGLFEQHLTAVDLVALLLELAHDVEARHRAVHLVLVADLDGHGDAELTELRRAIARRLGGLDVAFGESTSALQKHALVALGGRKRELARKQIIARVAGLDLHGLAAITQLGHAVEKNDFHDEPSSAPSGSTRARTARARSDARA